MSAQHISVALADAAFDRYEEASAAVARYVRGQQQDLFVATEDRQRAAFWRDTWLSCEREALSHGR